LGDVGGVVVMVVVGVMAVVARLRGVVASDVVIGGGRGDSALGDGDSDPRGDVSDEIGSEIRLDVVLASQDGKHGAIGVVVVIDDGNGGGGGGSGDEAEEEHVAEVGFFGCGRCG
jgi:hypothetical protein